MSKSTGVTGLNAALKFGAKLAVLAILFAGASPALAQGFIFVRQWPSTWWDFATAHGVAVDASDNVYVADSTNNRIVKFTADGEYVIHWGSGGNGDGQFSSPYGLAVDGSGNVYVADMNNNRVQKFTSDGTFLTKWGSSGIANGQFKSPGGIAVDDSGNVYVTDGISVFSGGFGTPSNNRVQKFTSDGVYVTQWGSYGTDNGQFNGLGGIAVTGSGEFYVADLGNHRIQWFDSTGQYLGQWSISTGNSGLGAYFICVAVDSSGFVYVGDGNNRGLSGFTPGGENLIQKFLPNGDLVDSWGSAGRGNLQFDGPTGIAVTGGGEILVTDGGNHRLQKLDSGGLYLTQWGRGAGSDDGEFNTPLGLALDTSGNLYVADTFNNRIQVFDTGGAFVREWGSSGVDDGFFHDPSAVAVAGSGDIFVTDGYDGSSFTFGTNNRVQRFNSNGVFQSKWGTSGSGDGQFRAPTGIAVDGSSNVFVVDWGNDRVQEFDINNVFVRKWGANGISNGLFNNPVGATVDTLGNIYVSDSENDRIQKFNAANGQYLRQWGSSGSGVGKFNGPAGVATDSAGNVFVADSNNSRIQKFSGNGDFRAQWGPFGTVVGPLRTPLGVAVDSTGNIYVADTLNHRILEFKPSPLTVTLSSLAPNPTNATIPVTVTFSDTVSDFDSGDITPGNAAVTNFSGSGVSYTFDLAPAGQGLVTASIPANAAHNLDTAGNTASQLFSRTFDGVAPAVSMSSAAPNATNVSPISVTVTFTEAVTGFDESDITAQNATISDFSTGSQSSYSFKLTPTIQEGTVSASIAAGVCTDSAGNGNTAAQNFTRTYDILPPNPPAITTDGGNGTGADFTTSEPSVILAGTIPAGTAVSILNNGTTGGVIFTSGNSIWQIAVGLLQFGDNVFVITAVDGAGNVSQPATIRIFRVPDENVFVSPAGNDDVGLEGTQDVPWQTITFAINLVEHFASAEHPITINLNPGVYTERIVLVPYVHIRGADPNNPSSTVIQFFDVNDPVGPGQYVVIIGVEGADLRDLLITFPPGVTTENVVLLRIDNVAMTVDNVVLDGNANVNSTGVVVLGESSSGSVIRNSTVKNVNNGLSIDNSGITIARDLFDTISNDAIVIETPTGVGGGPPRTPLLGVVGNLSSGLNRFRDISGMFVRTDNPSLTTAQHNDWGVYTAPEIEAKMSASSKAIVDRINYVPWIGKQIVSGCVVVDMVDAISAAQILDAESPIVTVGGFEVERDPISLFWIFSALPGGTYTLAGTASSYEPASEQVTLESGRIMPKRLSMTANEELADVNSDGSVDAIDIQLVINAALDIQVGGFDADINGDGDVNAVDVQLVINAALL